MKADFGDFIKHRSADQGISTALVQDWMGWSYAKARGVLIGTVPPSEISFTEAVKLAGLLEVTVDELANMAGLDS